MAKTVRTTSKLSMAEFCSTAVKYPCWAMPAKTRVCRNMAPPRQLKPNVWKTMRILRLKAGGNVIVGRVYIGFVGEYGL